ncbi:unnamed protein product [Phytomonas sp. EM1]|nr:unnamed protein product [Phytomonas sp. EM1]|eukprot:CCW64692.1 unnamed protein product [Phytomonas sp. isolate EM1]
MREGDRWHLYVPYYLAFTQRGDTDEVPPWSNFIYDIEIYKCSNVKSETGEVIDAYPKTYAKQLLPEQTSKAYYENL